MKGNLLKPGPGKTLMAGLSVGSVFKKLESSMGCAGDGQGGGGSRESILIRHDDNCQRVMWRRRYKGGTEVQRGRDAPTARGSADLPAL